jgi:hypothetical protein
MARTDKTWLIPFVLFAIFAAIVAYVIIKGTAKSKSDEK